MNSRRLTLNRLEHVLAFFYNPYNSRWTHDPPESLGETFASYVKPLSALEEVTLQKKRIPPRLLTGSDLFGTEEQLSLPSTLTYGMMGFEAIPHCLFFRKTSWEVEDLAPIDRWLIAVLAHTDGDFLSSLRQYLASYHSPFTNAAQSIADAIIQSSFGIDMIIDQVKDAPADNRLEFFKLVIAKGTISMLRPFLDAGIVVDEGDWYGNTNLLGWAAAKADLDMVQALLDVGANGALALPYFLGHSENHPASRFDNLLSLLIEKISPISFTEDLDRFPDPLLSVLKSDRAYEACPQAVNVLLDNGALNDGSLHGSKDLFPCNSQMFAAVTHGRSEAVGLFLKRGVESHSQIELLFNCDRGHLQTIKLCTWLTVAVEYGRAACAEALIRYGAKITTPDGSGKSAIEMARLNTTKDHPRTPCHKQKYSKVEVCLVQDMETLTVLEQALLLQTSNPAAALNLALEEDSSNSLSGAPKIPTKREKAVDEQC